MPQRPWVQVCAVALVSGLVTAVVAIRLRPDPERDASPPSPESVGRRGPSAAATYARLRVRFAVFRTRARGSDRVQVARPSSPAGDVDAGYVRENGMDVALGRRIRGSPRVFAIPGRGSVCLIYEEAGGACAPASAAGRNFELHTCGHVPRGKFELSGLVPDGVGAFLVLRDGSRVRLPVARSFVDVTRRAGRAGSLPVSVELRRGPARRREKVPRLTLESLACDGPG